MQITIVCIPAHSRSLTAITDPVGPWVALKTAVKRGNVQKRRINNTASIYVSDDILRYSFISICKFNRNVPTELTYVLCFNNICRVIQRLK